MHRYYGQGQQQFFFGQFAQANPAVIRRIHLALRVRRAHILAARKFNLTAAGGGKREALQTTLAYQLRSRVDRNGRARTARA